MRERQYHARGGFPLNYKSWIAASALATTLVVTGCGAENTDQGAMDMNNDGYGTNVSYDDADRNKNKNYNYQNVEDMNTNNNSSQRLGYNRYSRGEVDKLDEVRYGIMDREAVSDLITRYMLQANAFKDAATLVTDSEVLVAYTKEDDVDRDRAADIAKKTAISTVPRYFEVYVTDQKDMYKDLASLSNMKTSDKNYRNMLESTIKEMRKSPQGEAMYNDETKSKRDKRDVQDQGMNQ